MRHLSRGLVFLLILVTSVPAFARCGDSSDDQAAVTSVEAAVAADCNCCNFKRLGAYLRCARGVARAALDARTLRMTCRSTVLAESRAACPLAGPTATKTSSCTGCNINDDCGAGSFCQCAPDSCDASGGSCAPMPQVCPDFVAPVCGCDNKTYPNDCWRRSAGVCSSHPGPCTGGYGCFDTIETTCTGAICTPGTPCPLPNEFCTANCGTATTTTTLAPPDCSSNADCNDGNGCTADQCDAGTCVHACICASPSGPSCCAGPAALCVSPCGATAGGTCGGSCPADSTCASLPGGAGVSCGCVSGLGGPCGGFVVAPATCGPGLHCQQNLPDVAGVCVSDSCIPFFTGGCTQTAECCQPCLAGKIAPCAVCIGGQCLGAP